MSVAATVDTLPLGVHTSGLPPDQEPPVLAADRDVIGRPRVCLKTAKRY
jgi:hypothetical protein